MSIPYNLNIPLATNSPSVDQPNMETNTNNIATYVAVDHVAFNTSGSGQHNQVTFNANNVPGTPTSPPVLFTNTVQAVAQLFFYSGSTFNQYVDSANGSTFLLGGIIMKWGSGAVTGSTVSFPVAFPNHAYVLLAIGTSALYTGGFVTTALSKTAFTLTRTSGSGNTGYYYLAIGD